MTQAKLPLATRGPKTLTSVAKSHDENNLRSAREILRNIEAYGGSGSGMADWARAVVAKSNNPVNAR